MPALAHALHVKLLSGQLWFIAHACSLAYKPTRSASSRPPKSWVCHYLTPTSWQCEGYLKVLALSLQRLCIPREQPSTFIHSCAALWPRDLEIWILLCVLMRPSPQNHFWHYYSSHYMGYTEMHWLPSVAFPRKLLYTHWVSAGTHRYWSLTTFSLVCSRTSASWCSVVETSALMISCRPARGSTHSS